MVPPYTIIPKVKLKYLKTLPAFPKDDHDHDDWYAYFMQLLSLVPSWQYPMELLEFSQDFLQSDGFHPASLQ